MYNYWSYFKFLCNKVFRYRKYKNHKWFCSKFDYSIQDGIVLVRVAKGETTDYIRRFGGYVNVLAYRVYWSDGTISRWFKHGFNDNGKFLSLIGRTHDGEILTIQR